MNELGTISRARPNREDRAARDRGRRTAWQRRRRLLIAQGRWEPTAQLDPAPAREHLEHLRDTYQLSNDALSDLSGIPTRTIFDILQTGHSTERTWITPGIQTRALSTQFDLALLADLRRLSAAGTTRRLRALMRMGWSVDLLGEHLGVSGAAISGFQSHPTVTAATARRVAFLYDQLCMQRGPSVRAAVFAERRGYLPPLAWDDDTIDDPEATGWTAPPTPGADVDEVAVERALSGHQVVLTAGEFDAVVREGAQRGMSDAQLAEVTGRCSQTVLRWRDAKGIPSRRNELMYGRAS